MLETRHIILVLIFLMSNLGISYASTLPNQNRIKRLNDTYIDFKLTQPVDVDENTKTPILLWLQGSGCDSVASITPNLKMLLNRLGKNNIALLTAEKAGVKDSDTGENCTNEYHRHNTIPQRVFDYSRIIQHLRANASWWNQELYIVGASQGGAEAAVLAAFIPETKKVAILVSGGGMTLEEIVLMHTENQMRQQGIPEAEIQLELQKVKAIYDEARIEQSQNVSHIRALNLLVDVTIPIYMVAGTEDINDAVMSSRKTVDMFKVLGKDNLVYREYQGLDHQMKNSAGDLFIDDMLTETFQWLLDD